jgi:hypothetical protein
MNKDKGLAAATDPTTGSMYIVNGGLSNGVKTTFSYNEVINEYKEIGQTVPMETGFAGAWTTARKSMLIHGGLRANVVQDMLYEFTPSNDVSVIQPIAYSGDAPTARQGHCMISAYGGTKMIVFGGIGASNTSLGDIYTLDTNTLKWSKGTDGGASVARAYTACAVSNDMFVAWGGCDGTMATVTSNITIVYNLKTNQWVSDYSPFPYSGATKSVTALPSGTGTGGPTVTGTGGPDGNSNLGGIIGGVIGGLAVIGIAIGLFIFRRRGKANQENTTIATSEPVTIGMNNIHNNSEKNSPHTDPNSPPPSDSAENVAAPPQYHIFQPSTSKSGPSYHLAFIDHHQQNQLLAQQQQQQQAPQQQRQQQNEQEQPPPKAPQTFDTDTPPFSSSYTPSTNSSAGTNTESTIRAMTNNVTSAEQYPPVVRNPHTPDDIQLFASIPIPERHPHTLPH